LFPIAQIVDLNTIEARTSLPSYLYLAPDTQAAGSLDLPWAEGRNFAVGEFSRRNAAESPDRTVSAAKSWLCHGGVDRRSSILPWNAPDTVQKISPVAASQRYLEHLIAAWQQVFPESPVAEQQVVLTVPASFDAVARELTREAALAAGLPTDMVLLEEPQSAVYWWLAATGDEWRKKMSVGDTLLVCDVGGGTTDLTLVAVEEQDGELILRRQAVGDHLLVGGDNMDLALAHLLAGRFAEQGVKLDPWQSVGLWHSCRAAKETLLAAGGPETQSISVLGRGSKLIGGTVSLEIDRQTVADFLVDGFLPTCAVTDKPQRRRASGFQEIGLPFESDTAISRHLSAFLVAQSNSDTPVTPTRVMFNGGVFKSASLRSRLLEILGSWDETQSSVQVLEGVEDLDHAVARGAAFYGWSKLKGGVRIRGGVARSYYIGIETAGLAIPGAPRPMRALCVVPFGMEEGTEIDVPSAEIGLVHGEPAEFRFFSSAVRQDDRPGQVLDIWDEGELTETSSLTAELPADDSVDEPYVPVRFQSRISELGMFELWCVSTKSEGRWKLEFNVREGP
jgi:molecular chaperone DnaK (HSP70)